MEATDCADEESSPIDIHSPSESLPCPSPLRVAPSDGASTVISRENNSSVSLLLTKKNYVSSKTCIIDLLFRVQN